MHLHPKSQEQDNIYIEKIMETTWPPLIKHWHTAPEFSVNQATTHSIDVCSFLNLFTVLESFPSSSGVVHDKYTVRRRTAFSFLRLFLFNYSGMINCFVRQGVRLIAFVMFSNFFLSYLSLQQRVKSFSAQLTHSHFTGCCAACRWFVYAFWQWLFPWSFVLAE